MWKHVVLLLLFTLCGRYLVFAELDMKMYIDKCKANIELTPEEQAMMLNQKLDTPNVKCFVACIFKQLNIIDSEGKVSSDGLLQMTEAMFPGDAAQYEKTKKYAQECIKANEATVSDGNEGCERTAMLMKCIQDFSMQ